MYVFILQERKTIVAIQLRKSPGKSWKFHAKPPGKSGKKSWKILEFRRKSWNFHAKPPGKNGKKSWKVLEFESIFLVGTMKISKLMYCLP